MQHKPQNETFMNFISYKNRERKQQSFSIDMKDLLPNELLLKTSNRKIHETICGELYAMGYSVLWNVNGIYHEYDHFAQTYGNEEDIVQHMTGCPDWIGSIREGKTIEVQTFMNFRLFGRKERLRKLNENLRADFDILVSRLREKQ